MKQLNQSDAICLFNGDKPEGFEGISIVEREVEDNERVNDLIRLEGFKQWVKENSFALGGISIRIAGTITTVSLSARRVVKAGD